MKKHNFNAGPSILPREVIEKTAQAVLDFNGSGLSIMEISHRAKDFQPVVDEAVALFKELLNIPEGYSVLFLGGGASLEFCMIPFNFLEKKAAYLNTGVWAKKAMKEAKAFGEVVEVASSAEATYTYIPKNYTVPADADYFHVTTNNTIYGTELHEDLDSPVPMIADMSSDIFSRPIDVSKYICIYGGAQKNLAPAGVTFVIVKNDAVGKVSRYIPTMLNYQTHIDGGSMFNTPPVLPIYAALQTLRWIKANGGVAEMQKRAYNVVRALCEEDENPIVSIHDHGSAGHVNCLSELVEECGGLIDMSKLPIGDKTLSAKEIIANESQERMGLLIQEEAIEHVRKVAERERAPMYVVGETTGDHRFAFQQADGVRPFDLAVEQMFGSSPKTYMVDKTVERHYEMPEYELSQLHEYLTNVLQLEAVACKDWLTNKVDQSLQATASSCNTFVRYSCNLDCSYLGIS